MLKKMLSRFTLGVILLFSAGFMIVTNVHGNTFPFLLFPIGMIISGFGTFFHGPVDTIPSSIKELSNRDRVSGILLFAGMVLMLSAALLKAIG